MGMQNKLTAVGLYLAAIFLLYGRTEVFPTNLYKSQKAELSAEKRKPKAVREYYQNIYNAVAGAGTMKKYSESLKVT